MPRGLCDLEGSGTEEEVVEVVPDCEVVYRPANLEMRGDNFSIPYYVLRIYL